MANDCIVADVEIALLYGNSDGTDMNFFDYFNHPIANTVIIPTFSLIGGYLSSACLQKKQHRHDYTSKQLDRLYGPVYALISDYEHNRNTVSQIKKNIWQGKNSDFPMNPEYLTDDYEIMAKLAAENAFNSSKKIYEITISNISCAEKKDIKSIESFWERHLNHISTYGSCESPNIFSNYFTSTELPDDFLKSMKMSYEKLYKRIL